jgi:hypothetical protein
MGVHGGFPPLVLFGTAAALLTLLHVAHGQYKAPSVLYQDLVEKRSKELVDDAVLKNHPDLEAIYYPMKYSVPRDYYRCTACSALANRPLRHLHAAFAPPTHLLPALMHLLREKKNVQGRIRFYQGVIFEPCRGHAFNCCNDTYGVPEFRRPDTNTNSPTFGDWLYFAQDGSPMPRGVQYVFPSLRGLLGERGGG